MASLPFGDQVHWTAKGNQSVLTGGASPRRLRSQSELFTETCCLIHRFYWGFRGTVDMTNPSRMPRIHM
jgi:hypothetical protein